MRSAICTVVALAVVGLLVGGCGAAATPTPALTPARGGDVGHARPVGHPGTDRGADAHAGTVDNSATVALARDGCHPGRSGRPVIA